MRNLFSLLYVVVGAFLGYAAYQSIMRRYGSQRFGRLSAHLLALLFYGLGMGAMLAFYSEGWHRSPGHAYETRSSLSESLVLGGAIGLVAGAFLFLQSERRRKSSSEPDSQNDSEFPSDYVAAIIDAEANASVAERQQMAAYLQQRATKSGEPLPQELEAFVKRNNALISE
jgi:H+/Cl- antiporter ClcA